MTIRVGVQIQPQHADFEQMRDAWERAEELGVDTLFTWDHFYPLSGDAGGRHFECWTVLGAVAQITQRVRFGALVTCNSYRNPNLLADMARTVDHISGGRLILGIGAGWFERDYLRYGYQFGSAGDRLRHLADSLRVIEKRLSELNPRPIQDPLPIMIGGGGEKVTLRIVARHGHIWNGFGPPERFRRKSRILDRWCREIGRDPSAVERSVLINGREVGQADRYLEAGATHLIVGRSGPSYDLGPIEDLVAWRDERAGRA